MASHPSPILDHPLNPSSESALSHVSLLSLAPSVSIFPPAITLLPNQTQATLLCHTNNRALRVFWVGGSLNSTVILNSTPTFILMVPPKGIPNGMRYYCAVRNPENSSIDIVSQAVAEVTNLPGKLHSFSYNHNKHMGGRGLSKSL